MIYAYRFTTTFLDFKVLRLLIHYIRLTITFLFVEPRFRYPFFSPLPRDSQAWESLVGSPVAGALGGLSPQMYDMPVIRKSNISQMAYITGRIRDLGSNSSHETRIARLLATLQLKSFFCIFIHSRRYTLYKLINSNKIINK